MLSYLPTQHLELSASIHPHGSIGFDVLSGATPVSHWAAWALTASPGPPGARCSVRPSDPRTAPGPRAQSQSGLPALHVALSQTEPSPHETRGAAETPSIQAKLQRNTCRCRSGSLASC
ncbi:hypothetical protein M419DRAFT_123875 [Trichoderma reesei RUT C-30]|uniref:Uncharacterized protein n=1 Tax=Hypocrea jecorina (strain ATCC 56765 / BCRC 32924 / NRRL 11460 / Rut C-30) TaxID=1344414 RepID=A0A024S5N1_HYPJR|nr:hypothetical protein M419DRAFT_123875 [Trichoderma reesei RUT C-30]